MPTDKWRDRSSCFFTNPIMVLGFVAASGSCWPVFYGLCEVTRRAHSSSSFLSTPTPPRALPSEYRSAVGPSKPGSRPQCPVLLAERGEPCEAGEWEHDGSRARTCRPASSSHGIDLHAGTECVFRRFGEDVMRHVAAAAERAGLWLDPPLPSPGACIFPCQLMVMGDP